MIPSQWQDALLELQKTDPSAVIAGGAVRDIFCGREPKDVDFFCRNPEARFLNKTGEQTTKDYEGMQYINGIIDFKEFNPPFSIIYHDSPSLQALLESFDFGICQIAWNGTEIIKTIAFDWDWKHGIFTLRHGERFFRSAMRYERINQKYGWPFAVGEGVTIEKELLKL